jgi:hypothetical protein
MLAIVFIRNAFDGHKIGSRSTGGRLVIVNVNTIVSLFL